MKNALILIALKVKYSQQQCILVVLCDYMQTSLIIFLRFCQPATTRRNSAAAIFVILSFGAFKK